MPITKRSSVIGNESVGVLAGHLGEDFLVKIPRPLDGGGIGHFFLENGHLLEAHRLGQRFRSALRIKVVAFTHQLDFAGHEQAGHQQDDFPFRLPAPGNASEAIHHVGEQHSFGAGLEMQVLAHFFDGEVVAFFTIQLQAALTDVIAGQHRFDFGDGIGLPDLEIGQLGIGVGDEVIDQLVEQGAGAGCLDRRFLAEGVAVAGEYQITQLGKNARAPVAVFILAVQQDALDRASSGAGLGAVDVLFDLEIEGQLDVEPLAFGQPDQRTTTGIHTTEDALGVREHFVVVAEWGNYVQRELMVGVLPGGTVEQAIDFVVGLGVLVAYLGELAEDVVVNHFAQELGLFMSGDGHMPDLARHIAFFVGQEEPEIAVAADEPLLFEAGEAFLYAALECQLVGVDLIDAERAEVIDVRLDDVRDVADQEHGLEQADIKGFQRRIVGGLINRELGAGIDEAFDGGIEVIQGDERVEPPVGIALRRRLKGVEQGTLTF